MKKNLKEIISFIKILVISYLVIFLLTTFIIRPVIVNGSSMQPTLRDKDVGFSYIITKTLFGLDRGAIVTVYIEAEQQYLAKRVIGLPGETIYAQDGIVYIDDQPLNEAYLDDAYIKDTIGGSNRHFTEDFSKIKIPEGQYFVMGDNRPNSSDSRFYGPFLEENIKSNSLFIIYPFDNFGIK